jgi:hypothetical protein
MAETFDRVKGSIEHATANRVINDVEALAAGKPATYSANGVER